MTDTIKNSLEFYSNFLSAFPDKGKAFIQNLQGIKGSFPYLKELFGENRKNI